MNISQIAINEIFESIQGEGALTGCQTLFIRTQGCKVKCIWCDSSLTWTPGEKAEKLKQNLKKKIFWKSSDLYKYIFDNASKEIWVCFTGGEPLEQIKSIKWIVEKLHNVGYRRITIETSGFPIAIDRIDLIDLYNCDVFFSLSPKLNSALGKNFDFEELLCICNIYEEIADSPFRMQFKFVISKEEDLIILEDLFKKFETIHQIYLQVEDSKIADRKFIKKCYNFISEHPNCKLTIQEHVVLQLR